MPRNTKGTRAEQNLTNLIDEAGWAVMRAPSSGSSTERELPDVLAGNGSKFVAIEAKRPGDGSVYLTDAEVSALVYFSENFGATPMLGVKFDVKRSDAAWGNDADPGWRFFDARDDSLHRTPSNNVRIKKEKAYADGQTFAELFSRAGGPS